MQWLLRMQDLLKLSILWLLLLCWSMVYWPIIFQTWETLSFPPCTMVASMPKYEVKKDRGSWQTRISHLEWTLFLRILTKMIVTIVKSKRIWDWAPVASACFLACLDCSPAIFVCRFEEYASSIFASFCWRSRRLKRCTTTERCDVRAIHIQMQHYWKQVLTES